MLTKCYNGHKIVVDDELDGETIECPVCEEDFIAVQNYEELGIVDEQKVPNHTRGYIHMFTGLLIGLLLTYLINLLSDGSRSLVWKGLRYLTIIIGLLYLLRGWIEVFNDKDPYLKIKQRFFAGYYIFWKKIKFFRK